MEQLIPARFPLCQMLAFRSNSSLAMSGILRFDIAQTDWVALPAAVPDCRIPTSAPDLSTVDTPIVARGP